MYSILFVKYFQSYYFILTVSLILFFCVIYFSNYIRMCYLTAKFPGPLAYPIVGNASILFGSAEKITYNLFDMFMKYSIFRLWLGPFPIIITSDPKIIQVLLTNENILEKGFMFKNAWKTVFGDSIIVSKVSVWKRNRSTVLRGFSPVILKSHFSIFVETINVLTQKLDVELNRGKSFNIFEYLSKTTLDAVCGSSMGVAFNSHEHESDYYKAIQSAASLAMARLFNVLKYPDILYRLTKDYTESCKYSNILLKFTDKIISKKRQQCSINACNDLKTISKNEFKKPLLEYLMDFTKTNSYFTDEALRNEINLIIAASNETTATALSYILLHLAAYKDVQTKVYEELWEVVGNSSINYNDLSKLNYMEMVIMESMRLTTTVPLIVREVSKDVKIGNYIFPKGMNVVISLFSLHRNKNYWENPLKFDPERFIPENIKNRHPYAYIPFSSGPRNCLGIRYARTLMKTTLVLLLRRYEFHTDLDIDNLRYAFVVSLKLVNGHHLRITPRQKYNKKSL